MFSLILTVNTRAIHVLSQLVLVVIVPEIILKLEVRRANTTQQLLSNISDLSNCLMHPVGKNLPCVDTSLPNFYC
jgi:hypothetical protein